ncbi:MAG: hypothetical protein FJZ01_21445 [Candidatus Sericytochromatia bacterium]|nr:hypothetical protein [Candidatus Tanganyikabacteria bacterium]
MPWIGAFGLAFSMFVAPIAFAEEKVETTTKVEPGKNGEQDGFWVEVIEHIWDWEKSEAIDVVAYYRAYRGSWLDEMRRKNWGLANTWNHSGSKNEDLVEKAVKTAGWETCYEYCRQNIPSAWQNQGIMLINPENGVIIGHVKVSNSYDALAQSLGMYGRETDAEIVGKGKVKINLVALSVWASPIVLDLEGLGRPDLLAGPTWKLVPGRKVATQALRAFDLDGQGLYSWEWVGPKAGLLAWDTDGTGIIRDGRQLFGNYTWGKRWTDGYHALATLDADGDGTLRPEEFGNLVVWIDTDSDGVSEAGETHSLTGLGIESLNVRAQRDERGNASARAGFVRNVGGKPTTLQTWDWIAMGHAEAAEGVYVWMGHDGDKPVGGYFRLHEQAGVISGYSVPTIGHGVREDGLLEAYPISGKRVGETVVWNLPASDGRVVSEVNIDKGGTHLFGVTRAETRAIGTEYLWQAQLISGQPIGKLPAPRYAGN